MADSNGFSPNTIPLMAFNAVWTLADAGFGAALSILDYQRSVFQPWIDLQLALLRQSHAAIEWCQTPWSLRGIEQLA